MLFTLKLMIGIVATILTVVYGLLMMDEWYTQHDKAAAQLTYNEFKVYFDLAPRKWRLGDTGICHGTWSEEIYVTEEICVSFSFIDYWRAKRLISKFRRKMEHEANLQGRNAETTRLLKAVQRDIDVAQTKSNIEMNQAKNIIADIQRGIKQI